MSGSRLLSSPRRIFVYFALLTVGAGLCVCWFRPDQWIGVVATALAALATAWLVLRFSIRRMRQRLHQLREVADAVGQGDLARRILRLPDDDFLKLAESLDRMLARQRETLREQERLRQQLFRSEKLALIGELAATVAHEVNNPLDGLQSSLRIIRRHVEYSEQTSQLLDQMDAGLYRIETMVQRLLRMSRDDAIQPQPTRLEDIIDDAVSFVVPRLNRFGIRLVRELRHGRLVMADATSISQAMINLMLNAADAMSMGGVLTLRSHDSPDGSRLIVEVCDTGTGISPDDLPRIFEPFFSTKPRGVGTGLGLSIVARIIEAHKGSIAVSSERGRGTTFRIELPAGRAPGGTDDLPMHQAGPFWKQPAPRPCGRPLDQAS